MPPIEHCLDAGVAFITLGDRENGNRLNYESLELMLSHFHRSLAGEARVIVLRSSADVFCLGMDLVRLQRESRGRVEKAFSFYLDLLYAIYTAPKPVVCLVDGDVKAGGVGIVAACDAVLSTERTTFEMAEVIFGLIPANVLPYLFSLRISPQKARYLTLFSKKLSAAEACNLGLVDELFSESDFEKGVRNILKRLFRSSPQALAEAKSFTADLLGRSFDEVRARAKDKFLELTGDGEVMQAVKAFNDGETPTWFERYKPGVPLTTKKGAADR